MTKEVLVKVAGFHAELGQIPPEENDAIEIIASGNYYYKNDKHYILYQEATEGMQGITKTQIKITPGQSVEILKSGVINSHMFFDTTKDTLTYYGTPFGQIHVGIHTKSISFEETENQILLRLSYGLDINKEPIMDCQVEIDVRSKEGEVFPFSLEKIE